MSALESQLSASLFGALDEIERLRAERDAMREALEECMDSLEGWHETSALNRAHRCHDGCEDMRRIRAARAALGGGK